MIVWVAPALRGFRDTTRERGRARGGAESGTGSGARRRARRCAAARPWLLAVQRDGVYARAVLCACHARSSPRRVGGGCMCVRACVRVREKREREPRARTQHRRRRLRTRWRARSGTVRRRARCDAGAVAIAPGACLPSLARTRACRALAGGTEDETERASELYRRSEVVRARMGAHVRRACASTCTILRVVVTSLRARARATRARGTLSGASHFTCARWGRRWTRRPPRRRWRRRAGHRRRASR